MGKTTSYSRRFLLFAGFSAVSLVAVMIIAKAGAYYATGSASILSSLMDSILDSFISLMALASIYYASRPADEDHRWGHGKMEAVSALFQSAIIAAGGAFIVFEAINRFLLPVTIFHHTIGIVVMSFSIVLSVILVSIQRYALTRTESLALEADSAHYGSDIVINIGVIIILFLEQYGAPIWLDPFFALVVAGFLTKISYDIGAKALNMLMDRELPETERSKVISILESKPEVAGWHDLRMHKHGATAVISFDIEVDGDLNLRGAHGIAKALEVEILIPFPQAEILIHIDPKGDTDDARHRVKGVHH